MVQIDRIKNESKIFFILLSFSIGLCGLLKLENNSKVNKKIDANYMNISLAIEIEIDL